MSDEPIDPHVEVCEFQSYQTLIADVRVPYMYSTESGHGIPRIVAKAADGWWERPELISVDYCPWWTLPVATIIGLAEALRAGDSNERQLAARLLPESTRQTTKRLVSLRC